MNLEAAAGAAWVAAKKDPAVHSVLRAHCGGEFEVAEGGRGVEDGVAVDAVDRIAVYNAPLARVATFGPTVEGGGGQQVDQIRRAAEIGDFDIADGVGVAHVGETDVAAAETVGEFRDGGRVEVLDGMAVDGGFEAGAAEFDFDAMPPAPGFGFGHLPLRRPDGEMAPVNVMCPEPLANTLCIVVLFESRDFTAASFPLSAGECRNNGATRSLESALASSDLGSTASVGPGSTSAMYPRKFTITLVFSICAADIKTTCLHGCDELRTSIGSRWYGLVCHWPRSAAPEPVSDTFSSAHCDTEISRGGSNASAPT